jgi:hypothetical protein
VAHGQPLDLWLLGALAVISWVFVLAAAKAALQLMGLW